MGTAAGVRVNGDPLGTPKILQMGFSSPHHPSEHSVPSPQGCVLIVEGGAGCTGLFQSFSQGCFRAFPEPLHPSQRSCQWAGGRRWGGGGSLACLPSPSPHTPLLPTQAHLWAPSHTASLPPLFSHRPSDQYKLTEDTRQLGLVVCRGTSVVLICPQDGIEAIPNPFIQQQDA